MKKLEFMNKLTTSLNANGLGQNEIDEILFDFEEHFRIGLEKGKTEEEICNSLGEPASLSKQYSAAALINKAGENTTLKNTFRAVFASLGLGFVNMVFVLGPFMGLVGILIGLFGASIGIAVGGMSLFVLAILSFYVTSIVIGINVFAAIFIAIGIACSGILFFIGNCLIAKAFFKGTVAYLKFNLRIIKNGGENHG